MFYVFQRNPIHCQSPAAKGKLNITIAGSLVNQVIQKNKAGD
jgi:hypothetical protein